MKSSLCGWTCGVIALVCSISFLQADPHHEPAPGGDWAFHRFQRPAAPVVARSGWVRNPIDAFVLSKLEGKGLSPNRQADRLTLLKRVTYDITGLAPTPAELDAFLNDESADAYEKVVDRLLASPHFGERWAQHWLDLVRYSETDGFKVDRYRPDAYRYRDYVIRSFNADLPYDRFVRQQLAGDELEPENPDAILATGFLRLHPEETNAANYRQVRQDILDDVTEVIGLSFLGLTVGCARCHDHKFDPIGQDDYFEMQAFFVGMLPCDTGLLRGEAAKEYQAKRAKWDSATASLRSQMNELLKNVSKQVFDESVVALDDETQTALKTAEAKRTSMQMQLATLGIKQFARKYERMHRRLSAADQVVFENLRKKLAEFDAIKPVMPTAMAVRDAGPVPPPTFRLGGGDWRRPKREVRPDVPESIEEAKGAKIAPPRSNPQSSGRRSAFANWLVESDHPLTSRVIVNRLWQQYLGKGIVATPSDFGVAGARPTHPELLDFLASELVHRGWSLKAIHRLIATSATYRQASAPELNPLARVAGKVDADNQTLWHARGRRRVAESIRDVALQASGLFNPRMFDLSACPELPESILNASRAWNPDEAVEDRNRRSIYVFNRRNLTYPLFAAFDGPNRSMSCAARTATVTAPQALLMLNGEFSIQQAQALAKRLSAKSQDVTAIVRGAYSSVLCREPTAEDLSGAERFIHHQAERIRGDSPDARAAAIVDFCHALLNSAEFMNIE
ncbi:MAG: DUF1549 and DUF1553 domain-containing protein [Planctomycetota bacterium]